VPGRFSAPFRRSAAASAILAGVWDVPANLFPPDATWAGVLLILIGGLFLAALAVGVAARAVMPEHYEPTTEPDEPALPVDERT
jgi:hypothetical protein